MQKENKNNEEYYSSSDERRDRVSSLRESKAHAIGAGLQQVHDAESKSKESVSDSPAS